MTCPTCHSTDLRPLTTETDETRCYGYNELRTTEYLECQQCQRLCNVTTVTMDQPTAVPLATAARIRSSLSSKSATGAEERSASSSSNSTDQTSTPTATTPTSGRRASIGCAVCGSWSHTVKDCPQTLVAACSRRHWTASNCFIDLENMYGETKPDCTCGTCPD